MHAYSQDFREIIVQALSERGMGNSEVVRTFGVSVSWVKRYTRAASEGRFLAPKKLPRAACKEGDPLCKLSALQQISTSAFRFR
jgi:transposase